MRNVSPCRGTVISVLALMALVVVVAACGGGPSSPTAPVPASGGGGTSGTGSGGTTPTPTPAPTPTPTPTPSPTPTPTPTPTTSTGRLTIRLTDAPIDDVSELVVFLAEIKIKRDGAPVERFASIVGPVDLLLLQNGITELIGQEQIEAGRVQFIEFILDQGQSYVVDAITGEQLDLKIPSQKIKIAGGPFEVLADGTTDVTVDFDAEKSLKRTGNGRYQLKPFVSIVKVSQSSG